MQGCVRGSSPSPPAALGSLRTCAQGAAAIIVGPLGSSLARVRISLPSGPWANGCVSLFRSSGSRDVTELEAFLAAGSVTLPIMDGGRADQSPALSLSEAQVLPNPSKSTIPLEPEVNVLVKLGNRMARKGKEQVDLDVANEERIVMGKRKRTEIGTKPKFPRVSATKSPLENDCKCRDSLLASLIAALDAKLDPIRSQLAAIEL
ncbi:hypothetical protein NDU88_001883 [Pleurodeles waltl]|uniref:Uncharacterized protein n=1 Tax=Pleurodeles waltl TaxID=8319 RepID=A0AAV7VXP2_PLEWA|nr:hypothetical protein NDU88_001883 [Pleurodeles waltl]